MAASGLFAKRDTSSITYEGVQPLIKWTYTWMLVGLLVTAGAAYATLNSPSLINAMFNNGLYIVAIIAEFVLVIALGLAISRLSPVVAAIMFVVYAAVNGFTLSIVGLIYTGDSIAVAFLLAAAVFGVMSVFAFTTKIDLLQYRSYFIIALIGLLIAVVVNIFIQSDAFTMLVSVAGVVIFTGLTAYDTQKLKYMAASPQFQADGSAVAKYSIFGALQLYLDFVNLFLFILRLMGRRR